MDIGKRLRKIREAKGLTQIEVAGKIGMDQSQYSRLEKNTTDPSMSTLLRIASALNIKLTDLFSVDLLTDRNYVDTTIQEKIMEVGQLDEEDKRIVFHLIDRLNSRRKMKAALSSTMTL